MDYYWGVLEGFREKLERQSQDLERETGLVWMGDAGLDAFVADLYPQSRSVSRGAKAVDAAFGGGMETGRSLSIRTPVGSGASAKRGRRLTSG